MRWIKFTINTTTLAVDLISSMLADIGIEGIEIEDNISITEEEKKAMFIDILPELEPDDGTAKVNFYMDPEQDINAMLEQVQAGLKELSDFVDVGVGEIKVSDTEDKDWINNWKEFFKPFRVAEDIIIKPTWEKLDEIKENNIVIEIDPGTAFGTGTHETTKLCILGLRKYIHNDTKLLDIGCGSGILSIIGVKLGADFAVGTDIDPAAIIATNENIEVNKITKKQFKSLSGNIIEDKIMQEEVGFETYDIVVANILADVIIPLSAEVGQHMKNGGLFITSGIIDMKKEEVKAAILSNGFEIIETNEMGDWVSFVAKKPL
jgi:ribosomal protein L11 methyltransferase